MKVSVAGIAYNFRRNGHDSESKLLQFKMKQIVVRYTCYAVGSVLFRIYANTKHYCRIWYYSFEPNNNLRVALSSRR